MSQCNYCGSSYIHYYIIYLYRLLIHNIVKMQMLTYNSYIYIKIYANQIAINGTNFFLEDADEGV